MLNYVYYKLYQAALKSSIKEISHIAAACWLGGLICLNVIVINALLTKTISFHWFFKNYKTAGWVALIVIMLLILFFTKEKRSAIIEKYSKESNTQRIRGNIIISIYIALSIILIYVVAFYKPGKL
ncbi:MAG TPA: hypothetical protein VFP97_08920 [Chitinophagaceae bacterium]|nr:hypothetical protein [Chitinophagaceae bacterium]